MFMSLTQGVHELLHHCGWDATLSQLCAGHGVPGGKRDYDVWEHSREMLQEALVVTKEI